MSYHHSAINFDFGASETHFWNHCKRHPGTWIVLTLQSPAKVFNAVMDDFGNLVEVPR